MEHFGKSAVVEMGIKTDPPSLVGIAFD
jgi:hypothetical protein